MTDIPITVAKARLGELVDRAAAGEVFHITRWGHRVAQIAGATATSAPLRRKPISVDAVEVMTADWPGEAESAGEFVRRMRDTDRY